MREPLHPILALPRWATKKESRPKAAFEGLVLAPDQAIETAGRALR